MNGMDGFLGAMIASESILDGATVLHGPGGCRRMTSVLSSKLLPRDYSAKCGSFFFNEPRIPCTFVDSSDYIYGATDKVGMVLNILEKEECKIAVLLESPATSLIGDHILDEVQSSDVSDRCIVVNKCSMSLPFSEGFDSIIESICRKLVSAREKKRKAVNIIGAPFTMRGNNYFLKEMKELLEMMGLETIACIGSGCTTDDIRISSEALANVCICPEYCKKTSEFYESIGIPTAYSEYGAPIGHDNMRDLIRSVAEKTDTDPSEALAYIDSDEKEMTNRIKASLSASDRLNYRSFSVLAESSISLALVRFMGRTLKMIPGCINITDSDPITYMKLEGLLDGLGLSDILSKGFGDEYTDICIGPGAMTKRLEMKGLCRKGIDAGLPTSDSVDLFPKSILGVNGGRHLADLVINSIYFKN